MLLEWLSFPLPLARCNQLDEVVVGIPEVVAGSPFRPFDRALDRYSSFLQAFRPGFGLAGLHAEGQVYGTAPIVSRNESAGDAHAFRTRSYQWRVVPSRQFHRLIEC